MEAKYIVQGFDVAGFDLTDSSSSCYRVMRTMGFFNDDDDTSPSWSDYANNEDFEAAFDSWFEGLDGEVLICRGKKVKVKIEKLNNE